MFGYDFALLFDAALIVFVKLILEFDNLMI
ncbi:MAG: hypothetical protein JWQ84_3010 [Mucilaginibacter sp.]|nr:hypothetical protein [Mucilaginibacter sp.]MDB5018178.1 hypothetical protein [Mucilaginibacter sp.]